MLALPQSQEAGLTVSDAVGTGPGAHDTLKGPWGVLISFKIRRKIIIILDYNPASLYTNAVVKHNF